MNFLLSTGSTGPQAVFGSSGPVAGLGATLDLFAPLCETLAERSGGAVVTVSSPGELGRAVRRLPPAGGKPVHLCFAPPHEVQPDPDFTTVPVFGWGMGSIPTEEWGSGTPMDWRVTLDRLGRAICLSHATAAAVRAAMGDDFPVCVIHPPLPAASGARHEPPQARRQDVTLHVPSGGVLDTSSWTGAMPPHEFFRVEDDVADAAVATPSEEVLFIPERPWRKTLRYRLGVTRLHLGLWFDDAVRDALPPRVADALAAGGRYVVRGARRLFAEAKRQQAMLPASMQPAGDIIEDPAWRNGDQQVTLGGTIFSACHNIWDRSWSDAVSAFVIAFRDRPDATLVIQTRTIDPSWREGVTAHLKRQLPYRCRIVLLDAVLPEASLQAWMAATSFYVCASHAEAFALPMMRFMASGAPVISPAHSALADLVDDGNAIVVGSTPEHDYWPHDPREKLHTTSHRLKWPDLHRGYQRAYEIAGDPAAYAAMSARAAGKIAELTAGAGDRLAGFLQANGKPDGQPEGLVQTQGASGPTPTPLRAAEPARALA